MEKRNLIIASALAVLILGALLLPVRSRPIDRTDGPIPFVWQREFNSTIRSYLNTAPSRYVMFLTGPYRSGKSRLMDVLAADLAKEGRLVVKLDLSAATNIEDLKKLLSMSIIEGFTSETQFLSASKLKSVSEEDTDFNSTLLEPAVARVYGALVRSIERFDKGGISDRHIGKFVSILEQMSEIAHPAVFIHNFDRISSLGTSSDPEFGKKLIKVLLSKWSRRGLHEQSVPVVCEVKNSMFMFEIEQSPEFRDFEIAELEDAAKDLVGEYQVFKANEMKLITQAFGSHAGSIARVYEGLRYGMKLEAAIAREESRVVRAVKSHMKDVKRQLCNSKIVVSNITDVSDLKGLFEDGLLFVANGMEVTPANKVVARALC